MELQCPFQHLFLCAAQIGDVVREENEPTHDVTTKGHHLIHHVARLLAEAHEVTQIDQAVAGLEMGIDDVMNGHQPAQVAVDTRYHPDPVGT